MVAPTRTPQARGVKCELCKKILSAATWLDQTKLAKNVNDAQKVLQLVDKHTKSECPCIPKNIEHLLVGSTHFEVHRLVLKELDQKTHKQHVDMHNVAKHRIASIVKQPLTINDCVEAGKFSRFKLYQDINDSERYQQEKKHLDHLNLAIDFWSRAVEDIAHPFNTKLALRLGLTHHVIYACYLFKFYRLLPYQLKTSILLLNIFRLVDGVTPNALLHAYFLVVKSLIDCAQYDLAQQYMDKAKAKLTNYEDKSYYESILLTCADCELRLLHEDEIDKYNVLHDLSALIRIEKNDKLQHYYARTLAISVMIKYIQYHDSRSEYCFEFFHLHRFLCAIIRRCYESSFELVLYEKDTNRSKAPPGQTNGSSNTIQILEHSWIRFAVCDFSFSALDLLVNFYMRAGIPECLELSFNGLSLIAARTGSLYWQGRMLSIGAELDLLCDRHDSAKMKIDTLSGLISKASKADYIESTMLSILHIQAKIDSLAIAGRQGKVIRKDVIETIIQQLVQCQESIIKGIAQIVIYDCKMGSSSRISVDVDEAEADLIFISNSSMLFKLGLKICKEGISSIFSERLCILEKKSSETQIPTQGAYQEAKLFLDLVVFRDNFVLEFNDLQQVLEMLLSFHGIFQSEHRLLEAIHNSRLFLMSDDGVASLSQSLSMIKLSQAEERAHKFVDAPKNGRPSASRRAFHRRFGQKGSYKVAAKTRANCLEEVVSLINNVIRGNTDEEDIFWAYLKWSEPNPSYLLYRRIHELLFALFVAKQETYGTNSDHLRLLYHFTEFNTSNTLRYRLMMYEECHVSPYDGTCPKPEVDHKNDHMKLISFCGSMANSEAVIKSMTSRLTKRHRIIQLKYILDTDFEHLLIMCLDGSLGVVYINARRSITSDEFFEDARRGICTLPDRLKFKIEENRSQLLRNSTTHTELRQKLESDIGEILGDVEKEWLGSLRFIFCANADDSDYTDVVDSIFSDIDKLMTSLSYQCKSKPLLRMLVANGVVLKRDEFCEVLSLIYGCKADKVRAAFARWQISIENYISKRGLNISKEMLMEITPKGQIGLIIDSSLEQIPFETLAVSRLSGQGVFRVPSLRFYSFLESRITSISKNSSINSELTTIDPEQVAYVLDPANNLAKTRSRFEKKLKAINSWSGVVSEAPNARDLESWLIEKDLYLFIGHGAGTVYYNSLCNGKGLSSMAKIRSAAIVMGCSSGRMVSEGPTLESFGIGWAFVLRGSPCYIGLLWDVTDTDIDKYTDEVLAKWMPHKWTATEKSKGPTEGIMSANRSLFITDTLSKSRQVCRYKFLVGSTPVLYGIPITCSSYPNKNASP